MLLDHSAGVPRHLSLVKKNVPTLHGYHLPMGNAIFMHMPQEAFGGGVTEDIELLQAGQLLEGEVFVLVPVNIGPVKSDAKLTSQSGRCV